MSGDGTVHIFHIRRPGMAPVVLHPFGRGQSLADADRPVRGYFGSDPGMDAVRSFRERLHAQADREVRAWMTEQRFIPRFLLSALAFLVVYFILTFAVRDPIPFLVQTIGGLAASVAIFIAMGRRDAVGDRAMEMRAALRARVDAIAFDYCPELEAAEDIIERWHADPELTLGHCLDALAQTLEPLGVSLLPALRQAIADRVGETDLRRLEQRFAGEHRQAAWSVFEEWARTAKADAPLLALWLATVTPEGGLPRG